MLCGSSDIIEKAFYRRRMLGGQMRQTGVIVAGIMGSESMALRLREGHDSAILLEEGIAEIAGIRLDSQQVQTNLVFRSADAAFGSARRLVEELRTESILAMTRDATPSRSRS